MNKPKPIDLSKIERCTRCNCVIYPGLEVWMMLSNTDGKYYKVAEFPLNHQSQGGFPFGRTCADKANEPIK